MKKKLIFWNLRKFRKKLIFLNGEKKLFAAMVEPAHSDKECALGHSARRTGHEGIQREDQVLDFGKPYA